MGNFNRSVLVSYCVTCCDGMWWNEREDVMCVYEASFIAACTCVSILSCIVNNIFWIHSCKSDPEKEGERERERERARERGREKVRKKERKWDRER